MYEEINELLPGYVLGDLSELESFRVTIEKDKDLPCSAHATVKISVGDTKEITAAEGLGPVSALDNALRKALGNFYPDLETMQLVDFKVRVVDGRDGTEAKVRVFIESRDRDQIWSTIGVSEDIIEASWQALADSFQFKLANEKQLWELRSDVLDRLGRWDEAIEDANVVIDLELEVPEIVALVHRTDSGEEGFVLRDLGGGVNQESCLRLEIERGSDGRLDIVNENVCSRD